MIIRGCGVTKIQVLVISDADFLVFVCTDVLLLCCLQFITADTVKTTKQWLKLKKKMCIIFTQSYLIPLKTRFKGFLISDY